MHAAARRTAATHPSRMTVVVRVSRSEPRGVVQDASERRSSITKLHHTSSGNVRRPYPRTLDAGSSSGGWELCNNSGSMKVRGSQTGRQAVLCLCI